MKYSKQNNAGFTLSELMVVIIIIGLLTATIAGGIPSVVNAFRKITRTANAQTIMSTAVNEIKGDLRYARTDELAEKNGTDDTDEDQRMPVFYNSDGYLMTYKNGSDGIYRVFYKGTDKASADTSKDLVLNADGKSDNYEAQKLLTEREQANGFEQNTKLVTSFDNFTYENGVYTMTLKVTGDGTGTNGMTQEIKVRALNE